MWHLFVVKVFVIRVAGFLHAKSDGMELKRAKGTNTSPQAPGFWGSCPEGSPCSGAQRSPYVKGELHRLVRNPRKPTQMVMSSRQKHR